MEKEGEASERRLEAGWEAEEQRPHLAGPSEASFGLDVGILIVTHLLGCTPTSLAAI